MLEREKSQGYFNGLVLPHFSDYSDIVWEIQPGLTTQMKQLQSFQSRIAKKIVKGNVTSVNTLTSLRWVPLHGRRFGHRCCLVGDAMKEEISEHFNVFRSTMNQKHGYKISKLRTEWGRNKT